MPFYQSPPELGNTYLSDAVLRGYLRNTMPQDLLMSIEPALIEVGELAGGALYRDSLAGVHDEPVLQQWDAWGKRVDRIELTPLWKKAQRIAAEKGVVATAYERKSGALSRVHQFALAYVLDPSWHVYSCPLAMTDGAARTLLAAENRALIERALPRLLSRDPDVAWTSGQWMTERSGGSDVGLTETVARPTDDPNVYTLHGTKWFSSATTSQMALTLARPEGNASGGRGLALFYVETRNADGTTNGIAVNRLKDKLGTRMLPTAELTLDAARASLVCGLEDGVRNIAPMLSITRTWNAVSAVASMGRALALAKDYARRRVAFGGRLSSKPLHVDTLATVDAEFYGAFHLAFRCVELLGKEECDGHSEHEAALLRLLTPIAKLTTAKQAVSVASECIEAFGGAGYVEDTGLPMLLRDAQVFPIWEGTTDVLSLDLLRVIEKGGTLQPIVHEVSECLEGHGTNLTDAANQAREATQHAVRWLNDTFAAQGLVGIEAGARRLALTVGRALQLALLIREATRAIDPTHRARCSAAARRYASNGVDLIRSFDDALPSL